MLARVTTFTIDGLQPRRIAVEVDVRLGLPAFTIVGRGDAAVRESRERVHAALLNAGYQFPGRRITANLAPAHLRKVGPGFDLAIACGVLAASEQIGAERLAGWAVFGELSLGGELRHCRGALSVAEGALREGLEGLIVPTACLAEAELVEGLQVVGAARLADVAAILRGEDVRPSARACPVATTRRAEGAADLSEVRGHEGAVHAVRVAAAGGHNLLLSGPPGVGKTMLARRLPGLLPALSGEQALEVTRIHSVAGTLRGGGLVGEPPLRAPHHTISAPGLVGGGATPMPGEASLAHRGILFLDELSEFARPALEALRQPLEDGHVTVVRGQRTVRFPACFQLVASTNPCPCGHAGSRRCRCGEPELARHARKLSGPLLDRLDLLVHLQRPTGEQLEGTVAPTSATVRAEVARARAVQLERLAGTGLTTNAQLTPALVERVARPDAAAAAALRDAYARGEISPRGRQRVLRVARTVADLRGSERVGKPDVLEALSLRGHETGELREAA